MSTFDKVKEFLVRIVKDDEFRTSVAAQKNPENRSQLLQKSGYTFTPSEFDSASIKILELAEQGLFTDLNDHELVAVMGGAFTGHIFQPVYGVSIPPIFAEIPGHVRPVYGVPVPPSQTI
jgi:predicted ribosomally synthesized peptide with nif11-like leader